MNLRILAAIIVITIGCNNDTKPIYGTNNATYLDIKFDSSKLNGAFLKYYIDSVLDKNQKAPDSIKAQFYVSDSQNDLFPSDRLIHLRESPEEWYMIGLEINPCWVEATYNPSLNKFQFDKSLVSESEKDRIKNRVEVELFDKAIQYGKTNNIPDSIIFIK